jgi:hypothetical protein
MNSSVDGYRSFRSERRRWHLPQRQPPRPFRKSEGSGMVCSSRASIRQCPLYLDIWLHTFDRLCYPGTITGQHGWAPLGRCCAARDDCVVSFLHQGASNRPAHAFRLTPAAVVGAAAPLMVEIPLDPGIDDPARSPPSFKSDRRMSYNPS